MFEADSGRATRRWPVLRMTPGHKTEVRLLSDRFFPLTTHWIRNAAFPRGATAPCPGDCCALCETLPSRGLFYLACGVNGGIWILELAAQSSSLLEQHLKLLHGGIKPGQNVVLMRVSEKSPVRSECVSFHEGTKAVSLFDLAARVMALYRYPGPNPSEGLEEYEQRMRTLCQRRTAGFAASVK